MKSFPAHFFRELKYGGKNSTRAFKLGFDDFLNFTIFVLLPEFFMPLRKRELHWLGVYEIVTVTLFAKMYGFPLTICILSSLFVTSIPFTHEVEGTADEAIGVVSGFGFEHKRQISDGSERYAKACRFHFVSRWF
ncbi:MAG: hypothetical protein ACUVQM_04315 [Candidatus Hadarchaeaceae archaeon]